MVFATKLRMKLTPTSPESSIVSNMRVLSPRRSQRGEGYYPLQDVTGIVLKPNCKESIEYVLAYLNNERVFNWLRFNGIVKGEIVEFSEAPIASIPYLVIDWNNEEQVLLHDRITNETRLYIQDKDKNRELVINELFNSLFYEKSRL